MLSIHDTAYRENKMDIEHSKKMQEVYNVSKVKDTTTVVKSTTKLCKIADPDCEACQ